MAAPNQPTNATSSPIVPAIPSQGPVYDGEGNVITGGQAEPLAPSIQAPANLANAPVFDAQGNIIPGGQATVIPGDVQAQQQQQQQQQVPPSDESWITKLGHSILSVPTGSDVASRALRAYVTPPAPHQPRTSQYPEIDSIMQNRAFEDLSLPEQGQVIGAGAEAYAQDKEREAAKPETGIAKAAWDHLLSTAASYGGSAAEFATGLPSMANAELMAMGVISPPAGAAAFTVQAVKGAREAFDVAKKDPTPHNIHQFFMAASMIPLAGTATAEAAEHPTAGLGPAAVKATVGAAARRADAMIDRLAVRPTTTEVGPVSVPVPADLRGSVTARILSKMASPEAREQFRREQTVPAATEATHQTVNQRIQDQIDAFQALRQGDATPEPIAGTATRSRFDTIDQAQAAAQTTAEDFYKQADQISNEEQAEWQRQGLQAVRDFNEVLKKHNENVSGHNADLTKEEVDAGESLPIRSLITVPDVTKMTPGDITAFLENAEAQGANIPERPETYGQLKGALDRAKRAGLSTDAEMREQAYQVDIPKAEKALDAWFREHSDQIPPEEYQAAKTLRAQAEQWRRVSNDLRTPIQTGTMTGNTLRRIAAKMDNRLGPGSFERLMGPEAKANWDDVAKLFDRDKVKGGKSWGQLAFDAALGALGYHELGTIGGVGGYLLGEGIKQARQWFADKILFDPEFGSWFKRFTGTLREHTGGSTVFGPQLQVLPTDSPENLTEELANLIARAKMRQEFHQGAAELGAPVTAPGEPSVIQPEGAQPTRPPVTETLAQNADNFQRAQGKPSIAPIQPEVYSKAREVAQAFEAAQHNPNDPAVRAAYDALKRDIDAQWNHATQSGYQFEPWNQEGQPYANSREMMNDANNNKHLYFFRGGELPADHPMAEVDPDTGYTYNEKLRAVHDLYGHAATGAEFGPKGEEAAYRTHAQMFSPEAIPALTSETRAQNNWVNFGEHMRDENGNLRKKGEPGYLSPTERPYAENKAVVLPPEFHAKLDDTVLSRVQDPKAQWAVLQSENPNNTRISDEENAQRTEALRQELIQKGYHPIEVGGNTKDVEGVQEHAFFVPDMPADEARAIAKEHGQWGIITHEGLHELESGKTTPIDREQPLRMGDEARAQQYFTTVMGTGQDFNIPLKESALEQPQQSVADVGFNPAELEAQAAIGPTTHEDEISARNSEGATPDQRAGKAAMDEADKFNPRTQSEKSIPELRGKTLGYKQKIAYTVQKYLTGLNFPKDAWQKNPEGVINRVIDHYSKNLSFLYDMVPDSIKEQALKWYESAHRMAKDISDETGVAHKKVAAVISVLSPKNAWDNNVGNAKRFITHFTQNIHRDWTPEMSDKLGDIYDTRGPKSEEYPDGKPQSQAFLNVLDAIRGKKFSELESPSPAALRAMKGMWIRIFDEAHGQDYGFGDQTPLYDPEGTVRGSQTHAWGGLENLAKAVEVMEGDGSNQAISDAIGDGHKTRSFYNNIINPWSEHGHLTADTHAVRAATLRSLNSNGAEVTHAFGSSKKGVPSPPRNAEVGIKGTYPIYDEAYRRVAEEKGIRPNQLQSVTWEGIRSLLGDRVEQLTPEIDKIWQKVQNGKMSAADARRTVLDVTGGFEKPAWMDQATWDDDKSEFKRGVDPGQTELFGQPQQQIATIGEGSGRMIKADLPDISGPLTGTPQPIATGANGQEMADWYNQNREPRQALLTAAHEVAHAFAYHHAGGDPALQTMSLRLAPIKNPEKVGLNPGAIRGGVVENGPGWAKMYDAAKTANERNTVMSKVTTSFMMGAAMEHLLGVDKNDVMLHASSDVRGVKDLVDGTDDEKNQEVKEAFIRATNLLKQNWPAVEHMVRQVANHITDDKISGDTLRRYHQGETFLTQEK
jgi:hypothetical protein